MANKQQLLIDINSIKSVFSNKLDPYTVAQALNGLFTAIENGSLINVKSQTNDEKTKYKLIFTFNDETTFESEYIDLYLDAESVQEINTKINTLQPKLYLHKITGTSDICNIYFSIIRKDNVYINNYTLLQSNYGNIINFFGKVLVSNKTYNIIGYSITGNDIYVEYIDENNNSQFISSKGSGMTFDDDITYLFE